MERGLAIPAVGIFICALALVFGRPGIPQNGFTLEQYHNADAKFAGGEIITSVDETIRILNMEGQELARYEGFSASWLYAADTDTDGEKVIVFSNHANEIHIMRLSKENEILSEQTVFNTDTLAIDPILVRTDDGWLLAYTMIEGTINNPEPEGDNGLYTVKLFRSKDLSGWEYVTDIISRKKNLEDGDIRFVDGVLYYFFEMEEYDKGPSRICVMISEDGGATWGDMTELLPAAADNEMASCERTDTGWRLYVSSDYACVGESYQGASVYYADYTEDFEALSTYRPSAMPDNKAVRLYEAKEIDGKLVFLFARNFLTDCDLLLRTIEKEE